jgi:membrane protease YdiL (CAAX protease family)
MSDGSSKSIALTPPLRFAVWFIACITLISVIIIFLTAEVVGSFLVALIAANLHVFGVNGDTWLTTSTSAQFTYGMLADGLLIAGVYGMLRWFRWSWQTIGLRRPMTLQVFIGIVAVVPYMILYVIIASLVKVLFPALNFDQKQQLGFDNVQGLIPLIMTFISLVVLPPLVEETMMRGFLYTGLKQWLPCIAAGLLVSVLFGAAHLAEGGASGLLWIGAIDTFTLSLVLVVLREKTGNLWSGIALHATKNLVAFVALFIIHS